MSVYQPVAMTIAGSDSGGGAGIQADLRTFAAFGVFGTSAITCLTAQNPREVVGVQAAPPEFVAAQVGAVRAGMPVKAVKTGMLFSAAIIRAVADVLETGSDVPLVVDPVMVASSGARLLREDAVGCLRTRLVPMADLVTPNVPEAEILLGRSIPDTDALHAAAVELASRWGTSFLLKGGHLDAGDEVVDVLACGSAPRVFSSPRVRGVSTHGSGCTLSAAVAAGLARGSGLVEACRAAHGYLAGALAHPLNAWGEPSIHHTWRTSAPGA